jgi:hypothetical protein
MGIGDHTEQFAIPIRPLEMVSEDLFLLLDAIPSCLLQPFRKTFMKRCPDVLWKGFIGRLLNQDVSESVSILAWQGGSVRADEILANERSEQSVDLEWRRLWPEVVDGAGVEHLSDHRGAPNGVPFVCPEPFEARREQGRDGWWN